jgi:hypothetical protein
MSSGEDDSPGRIDNAVVDASRLTGGLYFQNDPDVTEKMIFNSDPAIQNRQFAEAQPKGDAAPAFRPASGVTSDDYVIKIDGHMPMHTEGGYLVFGETLFV